MKSNHLNNFYTYDGVHRVSGLRREPVVSVKNITLIPTSHWKRWSQPCHGRLRPSCCKFCAGVLCTELAKRGWVGIIILSGMLGSMWGSSRRLQVPYIIPRPGITGHMYICTREGDGQDEEKNMLKWKELEKGIYIWLCTIPNLGLKLGKGLTYLNVIYWQKDIHRYYLFLPFPHVWHIILSLSFFLHFEPGPHVSVQSNWNKCQNWLWIRIKYCNCNLNKLNITR